MQGVSAIAQRAIDRDLAVVRGENLQDLWHHDGAVGSRGGLARRQHFGHGPGVARGIMFLVFLLEAAGIFTAVTQATPVDAWRVRAVRRGTIGHKGKLPESAEVARVLRGMLGSA